MSKKIISILCALVLLALGFFIGKYSVSQNEGPIENNEPQITEPAEEPGEEVETVFEYISHESYRALYSMLDYKDQITYVIGHKSPDTDTVMSAIAMSNLLNELGIKAEPKVAGEINNETAYVIEKFGITAPSVLENAEECQLWLVDHSEYTQMVDGAESARIVGITDHHGIGSAENEEQIIVRSGKFGSTTAEIYTLYKECGVEITPEMAKVMVAGLLSDTAYLTRDDSVITREVYNELLSLSEINNIDEIRKGMIEAKLDFSGKTDEEIFLGDYKDYEENGIKYGICNVKVATTDDIEDMASRMKAVAEEKINSKEQKFLFYHVYDFNYERGYLGCVGTDTDEVSELLTNAFSDAYEVMADHLIAEPSASRKEVLVPRINEALNNR